MRYFPVFLDLKDKTVVVAGGGAVAANKLVLFGKTDARLICVAEAFNAEILALQAGHRVELQIGDPKSACFEGAAIVIAATQSADDALIAEGAKKAGALVNAVDKTELCSFITPSIVDRGLVTVAIGTEGAAPVLARRLREQVERLLPDNLGDLAAFIGANREPVAKVLPHTPARRAFWEQVVDGGIGGLVLAGQKDAAQAALQEALVEHDANQARSFRRSVTLLISPKEADDLTLRALRALQDADVLIACGDVPAHVLDRARRDAERLMCPQVHEGVDAAIERAKQAPSTRLIVMLPPAFPPQDAARLMGTFQDADVSVQTLFTA